MDLPSDNMVVVLVVKVVVMVMMMNKDYLTNHH